MSATYRNHHFGKIVRMEKNHFWFRSRDRMLRRILLRFVPHPGNIRFLEVGCGTGIVLRMLRSVGFTATGLDVNQKAIELSRRHTDAELVRSSFHTFQTATTYPCIGAFDVLEHQRDDIGFLKKSFTLLVPGGHLFLTVPAGKRLWSRLDELEGHKRRYDPSDLIAKLERVGFRITFWNYWQVVTLPIYYVWRLWVDRGKKSSVGHYLKELPNITNAILFFLLLAEEPFFWRMRYPAGATLVVVAQKPDYS